MGRAISILTIVSIAYLWELSSAHRLSNDVIPEHYRLDIITDLSEEGNFTFEGKVWIKIKCIEPTSDITVHSKDLTIDKSKVTLEYVEPKTKKLLSGPEIVSQTFDTANDFYIIRLQKPLEAKQDFLLFIPFEGVLTEGLAGYYRSSYLDRSTGKKRWLSVTQFEPTDARRAFPCFDEPSMKANFKINLGHKEEYSSVSNMPIKITEPMSGRPGWVWDKFEDTVPMSTYLVAYMVSDFGNELAPKKNPGDAMFRVWARKDALDQVEYAKKVGPQFVEYYEEYFDVKYPLPKQDMVAIPDFSSGAMENWGLITYRESLLLFDPMQSSASSQHGVASVIAHELAHQWFGNLVTMKWWTDLWLNEGFATYVASIGVHHVHPEWNSLEEEAVENTLGVFSFDSLKSSHPVSVPIEHPDQISQIFDSISYRKGSAILRMMNLFLGESAFRTGVSNYLKKHKYGNAEQDDLWESLTKVAHETDALDQGITIKEIMDTWTLQTGYPLVTVHRNYSDGSANISQARYLTDQVQSRSLNECWWIPLSYTTLEKSNFNCTQPKQWLNCNGSGNGVVEGLPGDDEWVLFNIQMAGVYKVNYDIKNWNLLIKTLNSPKYNTIHSMNRVQLIDDVMDLAWTSDQSYDVALRLVKYLHREMEYLPWSAALRSLGLLKRMLQLKPSYGLFEKYIRGVIVPIYERVGGLSVTRSSSRLDAVKHHVLISSWACRFQVGNCIDNAVALFNQWQTQDEPDKINPIPKDLRTMVYCTAIRHGGTTQWNFLWSRFLTTNVPTQRSGMLSALGCTREPWLINRYLNWTLDEESGIRKQDVTTVFSAVARNTVGFGFAKNFLENNIQAIHDYFGPTSGRLARYINAIADHMTTATDLAELIHFTTTASKYLQKAQLGVKQALEVVKVNLQWQNRHYANVVKLLKDADDFTTTNLVPE